MHSFRVVEHSSSVNGLQTGMGAQRQCTLYSGGQVQERIVSYTPEARSYRLEVVDHGPFPMSHMEVTVAVEPDGEERSRVTFSGGFRPKYGPVGWLMGKAMMKPQFTKLMGQVLDGIDAHLTSGRRIEKGGRLGDPMAA